MTRKLIVSVFVSAILIVAISAMTSRNYGDYRYVSEGEFLFEHYCTNCHNRNLKNPFIGPALGNISKHRNQEFLKKVTRNFNNEIRSKNELATCISHQWSSLMSEFEYLSNSEIDSIYRYIEEESIRQKIGVNDVVYLESCEEIEFEYLFFDKSGNRIIDVPRDTIKIQKELDKNAFDNYYFGDSLYNYNDAWKSSSIELNNFNIETQHPKNRLIKSYLIFEDIGFITELNYFKESFYIVNPNFKTSYDLYENQNFKIILIEESIHDKIFFGLKKIDRLELNKPHNLILKVGKKEKIKEAIEN